jgi:hypothetical protein
MEILNGIGVKRLFVLAVGCGLNDCSSSPLAAG